MAIDALKRNLIISWRTGERDSVEASYISFASVKRDESSCIPLLLLSNPNPLRWDSDLYNLRPMIKIMKYGLKAANEAHQIEKPTPNGVGFVVLGERNYLLENWGARRRCVKKTCQWHVFSNRPLRAMPKRVHQLTAEE